MTQDTTTVEARAREEIARIVAPFPFRAWQSLYDYCLRSGDSEEDARGTADWAHGKEREEAFAKADAILALSSPAVPWTPHLDYAGEPMQPGQFRDPPSSADAAQAFDRAADETGWLIEHGGHSIPVYWTGESWGHWSSDHRRACRFARRGDAHKVSLSLGDMPNDPPHKIVEHKWMSL